MTNSFLSQKCLRSDNALHSSRTNLATVLKNLEHDVSKLLNGLKSILWKQNHNNGHKNLRLCNALPNFPFTSSEMMRDY